MHQLCLLMNAVQFSHNVCIIEDQKNYIRLNSSQFTWILGDHQIFFPCKNLLLFSTPNLWVLSLAMQNISNFCYFVTLNFVRKIFAMLKELSRSHYSGDLMHRIVTIVNDTVLHILKLPETRS